MRGRQGNTSSIPVSGWLVLEERETVVPCADALGNGPLACGAFLPPQTGYHTPYGLSLSRLNHRLPGCEANTEVVQGTADVHHDIPDTLGRVPAQCG
jgi:hypothetical protein